MASRTPSSERRRAGRKRGHPNPGTFDRRHFLVVRRAFSHNSGESFIPTVRISNEIGKQEHSRTEGVTIPKELRDRYHLHEGEDVVFVPEMKAFS